MLAQNGKWRLKYPRSADSLTEEIKKNPWVVLGRERKVKTAAFEVVFHLLVLLLSSLSEFRRSLSLVVRRSFSSTMAFVLDEFGSCMGGESFGFGVIRETGKRSRSMMDGGVEDESNKRARPLAGGIWFDPTCDPRIPFDLTFIEGGGSGPSSYFIVNENHASFSAGESSFNMFMAQPVQGHQVLSAPPQSFFGDDDPMRATWIELPGTPSTFGAGGPSFGSTEAQHGHEYQVSGPQPQLTASHADLVATEGAEMMDPVKAVGRRLTMWCEPDKERILRMACYQLAASDGCFGNL